MKKTITTLTLAIITSALALANSPDSMYVHFTGANNSDSIVTHKLSDIDSIVYYASVIPESTNGTFVDSRDGNTYNWVTIGKQVWMAENLAYLPHVHSNLEFFTFTNATTTSDSIRYGVYGYDEENMNLTTAKNKANYTTYGVLYNWYAAMAGTTSRDADPSGVQGVCPTGWHLPSDAEWTTLEETLTGENKGSQLADSADLWADGDLEDAAEFGASGFAALPGGGRYTCDGSFDNVSLDGVWWSCTQDNRGYAYRRILLYNNSNVSRFNANKSNGYSVRCLKD